MAGSPEAEGSAIGVAAPTWVPGAMAAMCEA